MCNRIYWYTFLQGHTRAYAFTLLSLLRFQIRFAYGISWITPFQCVTIRAIHHTDLGALIAPAKSLDMCVELRLTVTETISCGFQRPIGQRRVTTPQKEKSSGIDSHRLQKQLALGSTPNWRSQWQRQFRVGSRGQRARRHVNDQVNRSPFQRIHHTRTPRLSIAASMRFDKLPSYWGNWPLQGWFRSPCVQKSRVTANAKAGPSPRISPILIRQAELRANYRDDAGHNCTPECTHGGWGRVWEIRAIRIDGHRWRQLQSQLPSSRLDAVIYVTEAAKSVNRHLPWTKYTYKGSGWIYAIRTIHI